MLNADQQGASAYIRERGIMPDKMRVDEGGGREGVRKVHYPSNSLNARNNPPEEKKVEKVVTGEIVKKKRSPFARLTQQFVAEDSGSVLEYLVVDVLVPAAKELVLNMFTQGLERTLYGEKSPRNTSQRNGYTNYASRSSPASGRHGSGATVTQLNRYQRANHDFRDLIIPNRGEAEDVLDRLRELIHDYGSVTVADFYEMLGLTGEFTDDKWGWYDLRAAFIKPVRGGYMFSMPRTQPISG